MWSFSDDEKVILKQANLSVQALSIMQLLKSELCPGSVEIGGRTEKAFQLCSRSTTLHCWKCILLLPSG